MFLQFLLGRRGMRGGRVGSLAASPTLVGAVTVLVVVVAVFLAYQANSGLPFVPTYQLSASCRTPTAWCPGNDVRIGGIRVGQITSIDARERQRRSLSERPDPPVHRPGREGRTWTSTRTCSRFPQDSTIVVRAKSALGLKYLEIDRGNSSQGFEPGATMPLTAARPEPVEIDQVFNMFDTPTRVAIQSNLLEFGNALAGRGVDLNAAIGQFKPLVELLTPVMRNLADPNTGLSNFVSLAVCHRGRGRAGRRDPGPALRRPRHDLRGLRPRLAAVHPGVDLDGRPRRRTRRSPTLPVIRPFLANTGKLFVELQPGLPGDRARCRRTSATAIVEGVKALAARAGPERPARSDGPGAPRPLQQRERPAGDHRT